MRKVPEVAGRWGAALRSVQERLTDRHKETDEDDAPPPSDSAPPVPAKPDPASAVPWGIRVAAETGWRLLVLAATLYVLMHAVSAVRLVVLAFVAALLITALLEPTVARLRKLGLPRGVATTVTFVGGFAVMGLAGWFVAWQVVENAGTRCCRDAVAVDAGWMVALTGGVCPPGGWQPGLLFRRATLRLVGPG